MYLLNYSSLDLYYLSIPSPNPDPNPSTEMPRGFLDSWVLLWTHEDVTCVDWSQGSQNSFHTKGTEELPGSCSGASFVFYLLFQRSFLHFFILHSVPTFLETYYYILIHFILIFTLILNGCMSFWHRKPFYFSRWFSVIQRWGCVEIKKHVSFSRQCLNHKSCLSCLLGCCAFHSCEGSQSRD